MNHGDTPYLVRGVQKDYREIFYSIPEMALTVPIQLAAGYGALPAGTFLAVNKSASGNVGKYVPYNPTTIATTGQDQPGRAFVLSDPVAAAYTVDVTLEDSYKFAIGDDLILNDSSVSAENLGAITAIDRTTYTNKAVITFTTAISGSFTVVNKAYVCVEAGDNTNNYSDATGILMKDVDTGTGKNCKGAYAQMVVSNAVFYTGMLSLKDAAAIADISMTDLGNYSYLK